MGRFSTTKCTFPPTFLLLCFFFLFFFASVVPPFLAPLLSPAFCAFRPRVTLALALCASFFPPPHAPSLILFLFFFPPVTCGPVVPGVLLFHASPVLSLGAVRCPSPLLFFLSFFLAPPPPLCVCCALCCLVLPRCANPLSAIQRCRVVVFCAAWCALVSCLVLLCCAWCGVLWGTYPCVVLCRAVLLVAAACCVASFAVVSRCVVPVVACCPAFVCVPLCCAVFLVGVLRRIASRRAA